MFAPKFEKACKELKVLDESVYCAKIDSEKYKTVAEEFGVTGYPTLKYFNGTEVVKYDGGLKEHAIVSWIKTGQSKASIPLNLDDLNHMRDDEHVFYTFFGSEDSKEYKMYSMISKHDDHRVFTHTNDPEAIEKYNVKVPSIVAFRKFDDPIVHLEGEFERVNVMEFIREKGIAKCMYFNEVDKLNIFRAKKTAMFLVIDHMVDPKTVNTFCSFAKSNSDMLFSWVSTRNRDQDDVRSYIDIFDRPSPVLAIVHFDIHYGLMRFEYDGNPKHMSPQDLKRFIHKFKTGSLERHYYDDQDKMWYHVVDPEPIYYHNYEEIVLNPNADVLVYYYSTNQDHLTGAFFHKEINNLSKQIARSEEIVVARYEWHKAPSTNHSNAKPNSIVLYPKGDKQNGIVYTGDKSLKQIQEFMADNSESYRKRFVAKEDL